MYLCGNGAVALSCSIECVVYPVRIHWHKLHAYVVCLDTSSIYRRQNTRYSRLCNILISIIHLQQMNIFYRVYVRALWSCIALRDNWMFNKTDKDKMSVITTQSIAFCSRDEQFDCLHYIWCTYNQLHSVNFILW